MVQKAFNDGFWKWSAPESLWKTSLEQRVLLTSNLNVQPVENLLLHIVPLLCITCLSICEWCLFFKPDINFLQIPSFFSPIFCSPLQTFHPCITLFFAICHHSKYFLQTLFCRMGQVDQPWEKDGLRREAFSQALLQRASSWPMARTSPNKPLCGFFPLVDFEGFGANLNQTNQWIQIRRCDRFLAPLPRRTFASKNHVRKKQQKAGITRRENGWISC